MSLRILTIASVEPDGASLTLSDGCSYVAMKNHRLIAKGWPVGHAIRVCSAPHVPGGYVLQSVRSPEEVVGTMSARPPTRRIPSKMEFRWEQSQAGLDQVG